MAGAPNWRSPRLFYFLPLDGHNFAVSHVRLQVLYVGLHLTLGILATEKVYSIHDRVGESRDLCGDSGLFLLLDGATGALDKGIEKV